MLTAALVSKKLKTAGIISILKETYPDAHCELNYSNPLELLVATILSAQCTDKQVNIVTESAVQKIPVGARIMRKRTRRILSRR